jgi:hypothetical protein
LWPPRPILSTTLGLNIARDSKLIVAAHGDGTIRWYKLSDNTELLALFVSGRDRRWVAWTPKGYYTASAGGENLIGLRVNRGADKTARLDRIQSYRTQFYRPDIVREVLVEGDVSAALRKTDTVTVARAVERSRSATGVSGTRSVLSGSPIATVPTPPMPSPGSSSGELESVNRGAELAKVSTAPDIQAVVAAAPPPVVTIISPVDKSENRGEDIFVNYKVTSGLPLKQVRITVGGRTTLEPMRIAKVPEGGLQMWQKVKLPQRDATIEVVVEAEGDVLSEPALVQIKWPANAEEGVVTPRPLFALIIAVGTYDEKLKTTLPSLPAAEKDALAFEASLKSQTGEGKRFSFVAGGIRKLVDPTRDEIEAALETLKRDSRVPDAFVIIYFTGHGLSQDGASFLLPKDYNGSPYGTGVRAHEIISRFANASGASVVLFLDACQSGYVATDSLAQFSSETVINNARAVNIVAYAASRGDQPANATAEKSLFTDVVVKGVSGDAAKKDRKLISALDLAYYVHDNVSRRTNARQKPVFSYENGTKPGQSPLDLVLSIAE